MTAYLAAVAQIPDVRVTSPYDPGNANLISKDGTIAHAGIEVPSDLTFNEATDIGTKIKDAAPTIDGVQIEFGGDMFGSFEPPSSETLGLAFAIFILIVAFGSVLAMGLPVGTAIAGIATGAVHHHPRQPRGVHAGLHHHPGGDDRPRRGHRLRPVHRHPLSRGPPQRPLQRGGDRPRPSTPPAGPCCSPAPPSSSRCCGMFVMGLAFVTGLAIGAALTVLATMVASVTLLPALLGFARHRVEITRWRGIIAATLVSIGLIGVGLGFAPLMVALPLAARRDHRRVLRPGAAPRGAQAGRQADRAHRRLPVEPPHPGQAVAGGHPRPRRAGGAGHPVLLAAPRLLRRRQRRHRQDHPPGLRPAGRGLRPRLQRSAAARDGAAQRRRPGRRSTRSPPPSRPPRTWRPSRPPR